MIDTTGERRREREIGRKKVEMCFSGYKTQLLSQEPGFGRLLHFHLKHDF